MDKERIRMKLLLKRQDFKKYWKCRTISQKDAELLGVLMLESYRDTIDYEGETLEDAVSEVGATLDGKYGLFLEECSFLIEKKGKALSACIVVLSAEIKLPLLAYVMTHPRTQNQGMATFLIGKSINALIIQGYEELYLAVTKGNTAAQHIYEKMGFCAE